MDAKDVRAIVAGGVGLRERPERRRLSTGPIAGRAVAAGSAATIRAGRRDRRMRSTRRDRAVEHSAHNARISCAGIGWR
jgi:hypothetical protein